ncbi:hypothetical protein P3T23_002833 [Paraburkholderia sp. GAS448]
MAAQVDPLHASAKEQSLHHFVVKAEWSDRAVLQRAREWMMPGLGAHAAEEMGYSWISDDTGFPMKRHHFLERVLPTLPQGYMPRGQSSALNATFLIPLSRCVFSAPA